LDSLIQEIRYNGFYPFVTTPDELAEVEADPQGTAKLFQHAIRESLEGWMSLAEERLKTLGVKVYISPGNDDDNVVNEVLNNSDFVINPEEKVVQIEDGVSILTFGFSNPTPWKSPRELPEEELGQRLSELAVRMPTDGITIYNIHVPPLDTPLDQAPMLDDTLKPIVEGGQVQTASVGSASVRELILKYQPTVALHGHVHEAAGFFSLGKTICINPGSEYNSGILRGALLNIDSKKQKVSFQLTVG
jgi:Icc-related predicted phosphoesterase